MLRCCVIWESTKWEGRREEDAEEGSWLENEIIEIVSSSYEKKSEFWGGKIDVIKRDSESVVLFILSCWVRVHESSKGSRENWQLRHIWRLKWYRNQVIQGKEEKDKNIYLTMKICLVFSNCLSSMSQWWGLWWWTLICTILLQVRCSLHREWHPCWQGNSGANLFASSWSIL